MKQLFRQNSYYFTTILSFIILGALLLLFHPKDVVTLWINKHYNAFFDYFFLTTNLMGTPAFSMLIIVVLWIGKGWKVALQVSLCFLATLVVIQFMKHVLYPGTLRPTAYFEGKEILRLIKGVVQLKTESFPSGHTGAAFSISTSLALVLSKKKWHWLLALAALSVGYARLYLSQHFITDVYTGMIVAVTTTTFVYYFLQKMPFFKSNKPSKK